MTNDNKFKKTFKGVIIHLNLFIVQYETQKNQQKLKL